ncbi:MAG: GyrI-like domain-containing protein [Fibrobacter sp.]|nr:GyrI-like domain-containing protein [Fibrobacter sp.]
MEIVNTTEFNALSIRTVTTSMPDFHKVIDESFGEIMAYMQHKGILCCGAPFIRYHSFDIDNMDVDIGWPIQQEDAGDGRIKFIKVPGCRAVHETYKGPYSNLCEANKNVMNYISENGIKTAEWMYEVYPNSPEDTLPEDLITEIYYPIIAD